MSTTPQRQREAARARLERQMAEKLEQAQKRKQRTAIAGAASALLVLVLGVVWIVAATGGDDDPAAETASNPGQTPLCVWTDKSAADDGTDTPTVVDVGTPPTGLEPHSGTQTMTISTSFGDVTAELDLSKVPCAAASFTHLAGNQFFDGTKCHRMFPGMLQCGDPTAKGEGYRETDGQGGPSYSYPVENLPNVIDQSQAYPIGSIAMANSGPGSENGSQFFIIFDEVSIPSDYTLFGTVTSGLDAVAKATEAGHDGAFDPSPGGGHPNNDIVINTLRMSQPPPRES